MQENLRQHTNIYEIYKRCEFYPHEILFSVVQLYNPSLKCSYVYCVVAPYRCGLCFRRFGDSYCLHLQSELTSRVQIVLQLSISYPVLIEIKPFLWQMTSCVCGHTPRRLSEQYKYLTWTFMMLMKNLRRVTY